MDQKLVTLSRFVSLVLRHRPEAAGVELDSAGWVDVDELLAGCADVGRRLDRALLQQIVAQNDKQRFSFSPDGRRIRANHGHSVAVDLQLPPVEPPACLFHGTGAESIPSIRGQGLQPGSRTHVHLSGDMATAKEIGRRHGRPTVLTVDAAAMHQAGHIFHCSASGVWLTAAVPRQFLSFPGEST